MMQPIIIPGLRPGAVGPFLGRGRVAAPAVARRRFLDFAGSEIKRPAVQGWACFFDQPFYAGSPGSKEGRWRFMEPTAFIGTLHDRHPKRLLFDHDDNKEFGSTNTGLQFENALKGLAFRMPLSDDANGRAIYENVRENIRSSVSVGVDVEQKTTRKTSKGIEYDRCERVTLREISLVYEPAVENTYAQIVDLDHEEPNLWLACRSTTFQIDQHTANLAAGVKRVLDRLETLKE